MKKLLFTIISLILLIPSISAQQSTKTDAHLFGHVIDKKSREHVAFATIVLIGTTTGTTTDATGHYLFKNLPLGDYEVEVRVLGYATERKKVCLHGAGMVEANFEIAEQHVSVGQVVVSANRSETLKREAPSLVSVLDDELFARVSSGALSGGLSYQPGVRVENTCQNCGFPQVRINGLDGRYSQILIDSHPLFSALTGVYGLEQIPANMIERVEVLRGGGSALYGSSAIGGTINVITKDPTRSMAEIGHTITSLGCSNSYENTSSLNASLVSDSGKAAIAVFGQIRSSSGYDHNNDGFTELLDMNSEAFGMRSFFRTSAYSRITAQYHHIKDYRRGGDRLNQPPHQASVCEKADHSIDGGSVTFDWSAADRSDRINTYFSFQNTARESYYGANEDPNAYGHTDDLTLAAGVQYVHAFKKLLFMPSELTIGAEYNHNNLHDTSIGYNIDTQQKVHIYGGYFQNEWKNKKWSILIGGRLDKHSLVDNVIFSPRVNLRYSPIEELSLRLSYAGGYRAPQAYDEDLHIAIVGGERTRIELAEDLKEERSSSWSASLEWNRMFGKVATTWVVEGFYTTLNDVFALHTIGEDKDGTTIQERYNGSGATVGGINFEAMAKFSEWCDLQAGFTWQRSTYQEPEYWSEDEQVAPSKRMFRTPDTYGYFTLLVKPWEPFEIDLTGNYTGSMLVQHFAGSGTDKDIAVDTPHFMDVNLRLAYKVQLYKDIQLELFGGVKNIFNAYQKDFDTGMDRDSGYVYGPLMPRSWFLGAKIRF